MTTEIRASDLFDACRVLFGGEARITSLLLNRSLEMSGLRAAYRKRARETHPDLARSLNVESGLLEERFKEVQSAFEQLRRYLEDPSRFRLVAGAPAREAPPAGRTAPRTGPVRKAGPVRDHVHRGPLPKGPLLFGRFLFYAGAISYRTLIEALVWQKRQRPKVGTIACQWGWLTGEDVLGILKVRNSGERFGECAVRRGYLDGRQLRLLMGRQNMLQPRLGAFFVAKGILSAGQVDRLERAQRQHNRTFRRAENRRP
jgi:hypothetical protein